MLVPLHAQLTQNAIERALRDPKRSTSARLTLRDHQVRGLAWIRHPTTDSFVFSYRPRGHDADGKRAGSRHVQLGAAATLALKDAIYGP